MSSIVSLAQAPQAALLAYQRSLKKLSRDTTVLASHVALFTALFVCWQRNDFVAPFQANRRELMSFAKIASVATYHKCIRELSDKGFILYQPSYHPALGSSVSWPAGPTG